MGNYNSPTIFVDSTASDVKTFNGNSGGYDTFIGKYNRSGVLQWFIRKGSTAKDIYNDFVVRNNVIYATGFFTNQIIFNNDTLRTSSSTNSDAFLAAFNQIGDPIAGVSVVGTGNYEDAGTIVNMGSSSRAYVAGYYKSQQIQIGSQTYTSSNVNKSDLFFAIYQHPFKAVITDQRMVSCNGLSDGMLTVTAYFGKPPYSYSWSYNPSLNSTVANNLPAGDYTVTVTDANGWITHIDGTITQPEPLAISQLVTAVSCYNGSDGAIDLTVTGGTKKTDYAYFWSSLNGSGIQPLQQDQTGLTSGTYNIQVKDDNLCQANTDIPVTAPVRIHFKGSLVTPITIPPGDNGAIDLHVSGGNSPYSYAWTGPASFTAASEDIAGLSNAGLYSLLLTDSKNCTADTAIAVNDGTTLVAEITAKTDVRCFGDNNGTATVTVFNGLPPYTFTWSDGPVSPLATRTNMAPGSYQVLVSDAALPIAHTAQASVEITGPASALNTVIDPQNLRCYDDSSGVVDLTVSGGTLPYAYLWNNGYTGEDLVNVDADQYSVTVTDANNCIAQASTTITQPGIFGLTLEITGQIFCQGDRTGAMIANPTGGTGTYSYLWNDPGTQVTREAVELSAGNYTVVVTDQNNCSVTRTRQLTEPDSISVEFEITMPSCPGNTDGSIIPAVSGGTPAYDYVWSNNVFQRINANLPAGTYSLTLTDNNNCSFSRNVELITPDTVRIVGADFTDLTCSGIPDGAITLHAGGGSGVFTYSFNNGDSFQTDSILTGLGSGTYILWVKDLNGCMSEEYSVSLTKSEACKLVIYDAFSPNHDGLNDVWHIGNIDNYPACAVKIFNSWGVPVFSSKGYGTPWDGRNNGKDLPAGTYYYVIEPGDGSPSLSGPVSLVK